MIRPSKILGWPALALLAVILIAAAALVCNSPARAGDDQQQTETYCLSCHSNPKLSMTLPNGEILSLYISTDVIKQSVHSPQGIECEACHTGITTYPHPKLEYANKRELSRALYQACQKCHANNYDKAQDSMHAQAAAAGNLAAPVCTDCHGSHNVQPPAQPRSQISTTCGQCHTDIFTAYKNSVHGKALIDENNPDVPVCTDCHGVHNIHDPRTAQFRVDTPELCAGCHANQALMQKYGLSADVYSLYKLSWHGVDVSVYQAKWPTIWHSSAVCTDCHGIHDILRTADPQSKVNPQNLLATCQKCHSDAGPNWTGAWTGHNKISLARTPFLFYTEAFYTSFTPFVLWVAGIYVALQIIRATVAACEEESPMSAAKKSTATSAKKSSTPLAKAKSAVPAKPGLGVPAKPPFGVPLELHFPRFSLGQRWEHTLFFLSFTVLLLTGLPQKYYASWGYQLLTTPDRLNLDRQIHHIAALVLTIEVIYHLGRAIILMARRKLSAAVFPTMRDVRDAWQMLKYLLFLTDKKPVFGKYNFEQKVTYWFIFFATGIMVLTGFVLWFPTVLTRVFPGGIVPAAKLAHSTEAIVAAVFVLIWHFYHVHLERLNLSIFTGWLTEKDTRRYHPLEYQRQTGSPAGDVESDENPNQGENA